MPHLILEYSSNVKEKGDLKPLFLRLHRVLVETASAELASCQSRAIEHKAFCIGDGNPKNAFVHVQVRLGEGRELPVREEAAKQILQILSEYYADSLMNLKLQISVESKEFPWNLYAKITS